MLKIATKHCQLNFNLNVVVNRNQNENELSNILLIQTLLNFAIKLST